MKTTIKIVLCMALLQSICSGLFAQDKHKPDLIPYSLFAPDTVAYLKANWGSGGFNFYNGHPVKHLLDDVGFSFKTIQIVLVGPEKAVAMFRIYIQSPDQADYGYPLFIGLRQTLTADKDSELYQKLAHGCELTGSQPNPLVIEYRRFFDDELRRLIGPLIMSYVGYEKPN